MKYFVLRIQHDSNLPILDLVSENDVDDIVGLTEETFTSFPIEGESGCREMEDNQYRYLVYGEDNKDKLEALVNENVYMCEAFFDDLQDPSDPGVEQHIYDQVGKELDEWISVREKLKG